MVSELSSNNVWPLLWPKNHPKIVEIDIMVYFDDFRPNTGQIGIIQAQFWDHIWNFLIKTNLLGPQYESGI